MSPFQGVRHSSRPCFMAVLLSLAGCSSPANRAAGNPHVTSSDRTNVGGNCQALDTTPCSVFTTPQGTKIQLGPYGAVMEPNVGKGFENTVPAGDMGTATCESLA